MLNYNRGYTALAAHPASGGRTVLKRVAAVVLVVLGVVWLASSSSSSSPAPSRSDSGTSIRVATWNVGAINNNPFEYWLTMDDDPSYVVLLDKVEQFVMDPPAKKDVDVGSIFTQQMYDQLRGEMSKLGWEGIEAVDQMWAADWSKRRIVTQFLKDPSIGLKRLVSMPDRMTNTINKDDGTVAFRPAAVNCYAEPMTSLGDWYAKWLTFMFRTPVKKGRTPAQTLEKIPRAKYPALTEEEERVSVPLQVLVIAIFDAIQVRMLNQLSGGPESWQKLRNRICQELNTKKVNNTLRIIRTTYATTDVFMLQESAAAFVPEARRELDADFHVLAPAKLGKNDQNSIILLRKALFPSVSDVKELSVRVEPQGMVSDGDLFVIEVTDKWRRKYTLASFHGDTNGLATIPVVTAVVRAASPATRLLFGLDANTYYKKSKEVQDVDGFVAAFRSSDLGLASVWGPAEAARIPHTTKNARTYMQPQLSKAASRGEIVSKGDFNPKDFILFSPRRFAMTFSQPVRDNTGRGVMVEDLVFPTLAFPSDHAVLSAELTLL